jgi:hypothetical protein
MNATTTHISIAAIHEAGHAMAALNEGRHVFGLRVSTENPGDGVCILFRVTMSQIFLLFKPLGLSDYR